MVRDLLVIPIVLIAVTPCVAQTTGIVGTVVDETQAVIPGAAVSLTGPATNRTTVTNLTGGYHFDGVAPDRYQISVTSPGFAPVDRAADLPAGVERMDMPPIVLAVAGVGETVVVTATKSETALIDAPASMTVLSGAALAGSAAQNVGELLRPVPGVNVVQTSARDVNLTSRQATSTLATSQLALLDGRSIYNDFFGMVLWDLVPVNPDDIKQIEVVRGPASAVWGANAMSGVVNIITKSARETSGETLFDVSAGVFDRDAGSTAGSGMGSLYQMDVSTSQALNDRWSYRLSGSYSGSDPYARPAGRIPMITDPRDPSGTSTVGGAPYPLDADAPFGLGFKNSGTLRPRVNARVDQQLSDGLLTYSGGFSGTTGIIHTELGPFDIQPGSYMAYGMARYSRGAFRASVFGNMARGDAPNLLLPDPATGGPLQLRFDNPTVDIELGHARAIGERQALTYGGNYRRNDFDITIMPTAPGRNDLGAYVQDDILADRWRFSLGVRLDKFGSIDQPVWSPRVAVAFKPTADHSVRASFNRAYRAPSTGNDYAEVSIVQPVDLSGLSPVLPPPLQPAVFLPFPLVVHAVGGELPIGTLERSSLTQESLTAYEVAYTGIIGRRTTVGAAFYINNTDDTINLVQLPPNVDPYSSATPPPGWLLPPFVLDVMAQSGIYLPRTAFTYENLGPVRQRGLELSIDERLNRSVSAFANYSWQDEPDILPSSSAYPFTELNLPPAHRFNVGASYGGSRLLGSLSATRTSKAFWSDVLSSPYHGYSDAFTLVNGRIGWRWNQGRIATSVKVINLLNKTIQQHVYGDLMKRTVVAELRVRLR